VSRTLTTMLLCVSTAACTWRSTWTPADSEPPSPTSDTAEVTAAAEQHKELHTWVADASHGLVLSCDLDAQELRGEDLDTALPAPTTWQAGRLTRVVGTAEGVGLLGDRLLRWSLARSGDTCQVEPRPTRAIRGQVLGPDGEPLPGARLTGCGTEASADQQGAYTLTARMVTGRWWGWRRPYCIIEASVAGQAGHRIIPLDVPPGAPDAVSVVVGEPVDRGEWMPGPPPDPDEIIGEPPHRVAADLAPAHLQSALRAVPNRSAPPIPLSEPGKLELEFLRAEPAFQPDELKSGLPRGHRRSYAVWDKMEGSSQLTWTVTGAEADGVRVTQQTDDQQPEERTLTWELLRTDSRPPRAGLVAQRVEWEGAGRTWPAWEVRYPVPRTELTERQVFADALPGPAVELEIRSSGELVQSMKLVEVQGP